MYRNWNRPQISRTPEEGEYAVHERGSRKGERDRIELPPRMARLIQKAQALEKRIPDLLTHPDEDPEYAPELKLYHSLNCHKTVLALLGKLSLKETKELKGNGEEEALALSDMPFSAFPFFTREDLKRLYPTMTPEELDESLAVSPDEWDGHTVEHQIYDFVDDRVSQAGVPCVVQIGTKSGYRKFHLQHSFIAMKTKGGKLIAFGKEGTTDPGLSHEYGDEKRSDEEYAEARFQFGELQEVWKHHRQYISGHAEWRVLPFNEPVAPIPHGLKDIPLQGRF